MIDSLLSSWILEFATIHNPNTLDDGLLLSLLSSLPSPAPSDRLAALLLLRRLRSDDRISESTLHSLELLQALLPGDRPSVSAAYAAVAAECAVKHLREGDREGLLAGVVDRVWERRIGDLLTSGEEGSGLRSAELEKWKKALEVAVCDGGMRRLIMGVDTQRKAVELLGAAAVDVRREIGRPFLEIAAESWLAERQPAPAGGIDGNVIEAGEKSEMIQKQSPAAKVSSKLHCIPSPEAVKSKEMFKPCHASLHSVVQNPLPNSIAIEAGESIDVVGKSPINPKHLDQSAGGGDPATDTSDKIVEVTKEAFASSLDHVNKVRGGKISLMDRNPTAQTFEWGDDSMEESINVPLEVPKNASFSRRRKKKWWSVKEEETLREAVDKYGLGNWKLILNFHRTVFEGRTEVDLKDKWRNMSR